MSRGRENCKESNKKKLDWKAIYQEDFRSLYACRILLFFNLLEAFCDGLR